MEYAKSINATHKIVSALQSTGIDDLFESVAKSFLEKEKKGTKQIEPEETNNKEFKLQPELKEKRRRKNKCC